MSLLLQPITVDPFNHPYQSVPSLAMCEAEISCTDCRSTNLVEDQMRGELICTECGRVLTERIIADDQRDFRTFEGDDDHKQHFGQATSIFYPGQLTSPNSLMREDTEFLWRGFRKIHRVVERLQKGRGCHQGVESSAKSLFYRAYQMQVSEKKGTKKLARTNANRQKFARIKQFVVASVWHSLQKHGFYRWTIESLNNFLSGAAVSRKSVTKCLKEIGVWA